MTTQTVEGKAANRIYVEIGIINQLLCSALWLHFVPWIGLLCEPEKISACE